MGSDAGGRLVWRGGGGAGKARMHPGREARRGDVGEVRGGERGRGAEGMAAQTEVDGRPVRPAEVRILASSPRGGKLEVTIHEARNRQVRRLCAAAGFKVSRLRRVAEGKLLLGHLPSGRWRPPTEEEPRYIRSR